MNKRTKTILIVLVVLLLLLLVDFAIQYSIYNKLIDDINTASRFTGARFSGSLSHFIKLYYAPFRSPYMINYYYEY